MASIRGLRITFLRLHTWLFSRTYQIKVGTGTIIHPGARIIKRGGSISIGDNCEILPGAIIASYGGDISIGNHCSVNYYSILYGHGGLRIGDHTRIAAHAVIIPANHNTERHRPIREQRLSLKGIVIGEDVWIGAGVTILDGTNIPNGCVIAAGAVVNRSLTLQEFCIYGGVPAKEIGKR